MHSLASLMTCLASVSFLPDTLPKLLPAWSVPILQLNTAVSSLAGSVLSIVIAGCGCNACHVLNLS